MGPLEAMPGFTPSEALAKLPGPGGKRFVKLYEHGTLVVELYAPRGKDPQQPRLAGSVQPHHQQPVVALHLE